MSAESTLQNNDIVPLISLPSAIWNKPLSDDDNSNEEVKELQRSVGNQVVQALQTSGFLMIQSDLLPEQLQREALEDATKWLTTPTTTTTTTPTRSTATDSNDSNDTTVLNALQRITRHPTDPKSYVMLEASDMSDPHATLQPWLTPTLQRYWNACEALKRGVLWAIGVGLDLPQSRALVEWHQTGQHSALRLLHYPPCSLTTGNRCKAHSDYGSVTLLSTDGVSGLEIFIKGQWWPVPHVPGAVVVNIGSLLSAWTTATSDTQTTTTTPPLLATLHRVAGPASLDSATDPHVLRKATQQGRTSLAFFADPDDGSPLTTPGQTMSEYLEFRSGGSGSSRSGVAFTPAEQALLMQKKKEDDS